MTLEQTGTERKNAAGTGAGKHGIATEPYRPSSGTEGMDFIAKWCGRCSSDDNEDCAILAATFALSPGEPGYPTEWRYERGEPVCSAFEAADPLDQPFMRAAACRDMFAGYPRRPTQGEQVRMIVAGRGGSA